MMTRAIDWPERLNAFIESRRNLPFSWGVNDCCIFASDWIALLVGFDPAEHFQLRGRYDSELGAARILKVLGGVESIAQALCLSMDWPHQDPRLARRGDIVILNTPRGNTLGVCVGIKSVFPAENGIGFVDTSLVRSSYRIA